MKRKLWLSRLVDDIKLRKAIGANFSCLNKKENKKKKKTSTLILLRIDIELVFLHVEILYPHTMESESVMASDMLNQQPFDVTRIIN